MKGEKPMDTNDLKQHEFENDIQRFMQIRDQVHEEIWRAT